MLTLCKEPAQVSINIHSMPVSWENWRHNTSNKCSLSARSPEEEWALPCSSWMVFRRITWFWGSAWDPLPLTILKPDGSHAHGSSEASALIILCQEDKTWLTVLCGTFSDVRTRLLECLFVYIWSKLRISKEMSEDIPSAPSFLQRCTVSFERHALRQ